MEIKLKNQLQLKVTQKIHTKKKQSPLKKFSELLLNSALLRHKVTLKLLLLKVSMQIKLNLKRTLLELPEKYKETVALFMTPQLFNVMMSLVKRTLLLHQEVLPKLIHQLMVLLMVHQLELLRQLMLPKLSHLEPYLRLLSNKEPLKLEVMLRQLPLKRKHGKTVKTKRMQLELREQSKEPAVQTTEKVIKDGLLLWPRRRKLLMSQEKYLNNT